jgi:peptidoglycan/xylan/chitin deacetylase (PgdA/CDA1 family)
LTPGEATLFGGLRPLVGPLDPLPFRLDGPAELLADAASGLPDGAARPEAIVVRLRRRGVEVEAGAPELLHARGFVRWSEARGRSSVAVWRVDPALLTELQLGAFHRATTFGRGVRRALMPAAAKSLVGVRAGGRAVRALADAAFWRGVRSAATDREWRHLTTGYSVLLYHRLAGEFKAGQERLDVPPRQFARQMRALRRAGFTPVRLDEVVAFHHVQAPLPPRAVLVTADDAYEDATAVLTEHGHVHPVMFVPTRARTAHWTDHEPLAGAEALVALRAAGGALGAHSRTHPDLTTLDDLALKGEVDGALADLGDDTAFAYPHGRHDARVRERARGARLAFTTDIGRNGAGTDPWCLRRVNVKAHDGLPAFVWKALTNENLPGYWERAADRRSSRRAARAAAGRSHAAPPPPPAA